MYKNKEQEWIISEGGGVKLELQYYREMKENYNKLRHCGMLKGRQIFLFGHWNATEELAKIF